MLFTVMLWKVVSFHPIKVYTTGNHMWRTESTMEKRYWLIIYFLGEADLKGCVFTCLIFVTWKGQHQIFLVIFLNKNSENSGVRNRLRCHYRSSEIIGWTHPIECNRKNLFFKNSIIFHHYACQSTCNTNFFIFFVIVDHWAQNFNRWSAHR